ncbi:hypothetical protein [Hyphomonas sp.]|uniref:hypothetical protein n=1 Tax=Hyphomonas sp. TaxID=87 RepID=UPI00356B334F
MEYPHAGGPFEDLNALEGTLAPLFAEELSVNYLPWASANAASASRDKKRSSATLGDGVFEQSTQRYAARAFRAVRSAVAKSSENTALQDFLATVGARKHLS